MIAPALFSSASDEWETPQRFFEALHAEFRFNLDVCATQENHKLWPFISPQQDGLKQSWATHTCWLNPPYSKTGEWLAKAVAEIAHGATTVALVPARTDTKWWRHAFAHADEIRLIAGRLRFGASKNSAPFPSALIIFRPRAVRHPPRVVCWDQPRERAEKGVDGC